MTPLNIRRYNVPAAKPPSEMGKVDQIEEFLAVRGTDRVARSDIAALAREHGPKAVKILAQIMSSAKTKPLVRVAAARELLDRGYGKATVHIAPGEREDADLEEMAKAILVKRGLVVDATLAEPKPANLLPPAKKATPVARKTKCKKK